MTHTRNNILSLYRAKTCELVSRCSLASRRSNEQFTKNRDDEILLFTMYIQIRTVSSHDRVAINQS